jgi:hypothetical protein
MVVVTLQWFGIVRQGVGDLSSPEAWKVCGCPNVQRELYKDVLHLL